MKKSVSEQIQKTEKELGVKGIQVNDTKVLEMMNNGILVDLNINRIRFVKRLRKEDLNIEVLDSSFDRYILLGQKLTFAERIVDELNSIEIGARNTLYKRGFKTPIGMFLPKKDFLKWRDEVEVYKKSYFSKLDYIKNNYADIKKDVVENYIVISKGLFKGQIQRDQFLEVINQIIPTIEEIESSFHFDYNISIVALPSVLQKDLLKTKEDLEIRNAIIDNKRKLIDDFFYSIAGQAVNLVYDVAQKVQESIKSNDGVIVGRTSVQIRNLKRKLERLASFTDSEKIYEYLKSISEIADRKSNNMQVEDVQRKFKELEKETKEQINEITKKTKISFLEL